MAGLAYALNRGLNINDVKVLTAAGNWAMVNEGAVVVNKIVGAATQVTLTPSPDTGIFRWIIDGKGDAATNNITVIGAAAETINGGVNHVISENYGAVCFVYNGTEWNIASQGISVAAAELAFLNGVTAGTGQASKAVVLDASGDYFGPNGGGIVVGHTAQITVSDGDGATDLVPEVQVLGTAAADGSILAASYNTTNTRAVAPHVAMLKGGAATIVNTTAVADNEVVGVVVAYGTDGVDAETPVAAIQFVVDDVGGPGAGAIGGSLEFYTTADGGEVLTLACTIDNAQNLVVADTNGVLVGSATAVTISDGDGATNLIPEVQVLGTAAADGSILAASFNTTNTRAVSPHVALVKGAAATQVATTAVADNEVVGSIIAYGSDGVDFETPVAAIEFVVDDVGAPGAGAIGGSLEFYTTADGGETLTLAMTIGNNQSAAFTGAITSSAPTGGGIGYATGAGGAVTQITNRSTGVTLSKLTGAITTDTTSLAGLATATFTVTNTTVAIGDTIILSQRSGAAQPTTICQVSAVAAGSFNITVINTHTTNAETGAIVLNFAVIKAVSA